MNFIGHAAVALWERRDPAFVLGAMLPDLANMAGLRLPRSLASAALAEGVAHHHQVDDLFHADAAFTALTQLTLDRLSALGVPRGPARGVAHVGVEMLLDGELLRDLEVQDAYEGALTQLSLVRGLFPAPIDQARWDALALRLHAHGAPHDYRDTDAVALRLMHVFKTRPRLALDSESEQIVRRTLPDVQRYVVPQAPTLLSRLRAQTTNGK